MDWKKEIKLSDLFRRRAKAAPASAPAEERRAAKAAPERASLLRRNVRLPFPRGRKRGGEAAASAPPVPPSERRLRLHGRRGAPAVPAVPLMRAFNLLPREEPRHTRVRQVGVRRRPSNAQVALVVVALVIIAALTSAFLVMSARVADKQARHDDLRERLAARKVPAEDPKGSAADQALTREREQRRSALASALGSRVAWDRLLRELSLVLPEDVWLKSLTAHAPGSAASGDAAGENTPAPASSFQINGYTRDQAGVARLLARMAVLPELTSVRLLSSARVELGGEDVVEFTIAAGVKPGAAGGTT